MRAGGATPATIAVIGGRVKIGLDDDDLAWLGTRRRRAQAQPRRRCPCDRHRDARRDDGRGDDALRAPRRDRGLRDRRDRRRAPRRGRDDVRRFRRPRRDWRAPRSRSSARAPRRSSTCPRRSKRWRRAAFRSWAMAPPSSRRSASRCSGLRVGRRLDRGARDRRADPRAHWALGSPDRDAGRQSRSRPADEIAARGDRRAHRGRAARPRTQPGSRGRESRRSCSTGSYASTGGRSLTANIALVENNVRLATAVAVALAEVAAAAQKATQMPRVHG